MAACSSLKCSVCLELYSDPRVLPCLHTFCLECLQGLVTNNSLTCPQCRTKHSEGKGGVASYPVDLSIIPELEVTKGQDKVKICGFCTTGDIAVGHCEQCGEYLCECCRDVVHKRGKMFQSHNVSSVEEAVPVSSTSKEYLHCLQHAKYDLEVYCKTCDIVVCSMCMLGSAHKGHQYDFMKNVNDELMKRIRDITEDVKKKEREWRSSLESVEKFEALLGSKRTALESEITTTCDEYISKIQEMKVKLLKDVEAQFTEDSKKVWATKNNLEVKLLQATGCIAFSSRYLKQGHIVSLTNQLLSSLKEVKSTQIYTDIQKAIIPRTTFNRSKLAPQSLGTLSKVIKGKFKQDHEAKLLKKTTVSFVLEEPHPFMTFFRWECDLYCSDTKLKPTCYSFRIVKKNVILFEFIPTMLVEYRLVLKTGSQHFQHTITINDSFNLDGKRVKRSPTWTRGNEDGGPGKLGTILWKEPSYDHHVSVQWDATGLTSIGYGFSELEFVKDTL